MTIKVAALAHINYCSFYRMKAAFIISEISKRFIEINIV